MVRLLLIRALLPLLALQGGIGASSQSVYGTACPSTASTPSELLAAANGYREKRELEPAAHCYAKTADLAASAGDARVEGAARFALALLLYDRGLYEAARAQSGRALPLFEATGDRLSAARAVRLDGSVAYMRGDIPEATRKYEQALAAFTELGAERDRILTLVNLTRTYKGPDLEKKIDEALELTRKAGERESEGVLLHLRGDDRFGRGQFDAAVTALTQAIAIFESIDDKGHLGDAYVSLGRIMRAHGRVEEAIGYYDRALAIQAITGDIRGRVQSLNAKAIALGNLGRRPESRVAYEQALELAQKSGSSRLVNFQRGNLAAAYGEEGDYAKAIALLREVLAEEKDPYVLAYRHGALATYLQESGDSKSAAEHSAKAIAFARQVNNRDLLPGLLSRSGEILRAQGRSDEALAAASESVQILEEIRAHLVPLDYMKRGFGETWQATYGTLLAILYERGEIARALATSEMARARAFLDLLASRDLADHAPPAAAALTSAGEDLRSSGAVATTASAAEIAATAARFGSTVLSYWVADTEIFAWIASPDGIVHSARVPARRADVAKLVAESIPAPGRPTADAFARLHRLLIEPVAAWLPHDGEPLTIVPHGPLFRLSFAALRNSRGTYLVEQYPLTYTPSITALTMTEKRAASVNTAGAYVLVADPAPLPVSNPRLAPLPAARSEASAIVKVVGAGKTSLLAGAAASETSVREAVRDARVIHFATHGLIRDDEPFDSFLALGATGSDATGDGRLTVREIYDMPLRAELVVMSACRTATGAPSGDGIAGLSRALFYGGTPSVLATLWDVADEPSATLMSAFYRNWGKGLDKRAALRQAQLELIRALRSGNVRVKTKLGTVPLREEPFYWAAYILVGER